MSRRGWPASMVQIAELIGDDAALALVDAYRGVRLSIPRRAHPRSALSGVIGFEAAAKLCDEFGPTQIDVPTMFAARAAKASIAADDRPTTVIARALGVSARYVRRVRQSLNPVSMDEK